MTEPYTMVEVEATDAVRSATSGTRTIDLGDALGCTAMRPRLWFVEPGNHRKTYHRHAVQEELYYVVSGPGRIQVAGEALTVPTGAALRVPPETPRRVFNDADEEHVWLVVGAPNLDDPGIAVADE